MFIEWKKENEAIKDRIIRDIRTFFEKENKESNWDKNKTLSIKEYLDVNKPYLKDIINMVKKRIDTWKI